MFIFDPTEEDQQLFLPHSESFLLRVQSQNSTFLALALILFCVLCFFYLIFIKYCLSQLFLSHYIYVFRAHTQ